MTEKEKRYQDSFSGRFSGIIPWEKFDELWDRLKQNPEDWYVFQPDSKDVPPEKVMEKVAFLAFLDEVDAFLHEQQYANYCGAVYVDNIQTPQFIKVFHPRKMGSGCSVGGGKHSVILPWWTISKVTPDMITEATDETPKKNGMI